MVCFVKWKVLIGGDCPNVSHGSKTLLLCIWLCPTCKVGVVHWVKANKIIDRWHYKVVDIALIGANGISIAERSLLSGQCKRSQFQISRARRNAFIREIVSGRAIKHCPIVDKVDIEWPPGRVYLGSISLVIDETRDGWRDVYIGLNSPSVCPWRNRSLFREQRRCAGLG